MCRFLLLNSFFSFELSLCMVVPAASSTFSLVFSRKCFGWFSPWDGVWLPSDRGLRCHCRPERSRCLQPRRVGGSDPTGRSTGGGFCVNSAPHRARITHASIFWRMAQGHNVAAFGCLSKISHPHERIAWLDRIPFPLPHSTPSLLDPLDRTILLTGYEPNDPVVVGSTDVTTVLLPSREASIGSTDNSGEDIVTTPALSEVANLGMLASPLLTQAWEREKCCRFQDFITPTEKVLSHVHQREDPCNVLTQQKVKSRFKCFAGVPFRKRKDSF